MFLLIFPLSSVGWCGPSPRLLWESERGWDALAPLGGEALPDAAGRELKPGHPGGGCWLSAEPVSWVLEGKQTNRHRQNMPWFNSVWQLCKTPLLSLSLTISHNHLPLAFRFSFDLNTEILSISLCIIFIVQYIRDPLALFRLLSPSLQQFHWLFLSPLLSRPCVLVC